MLRSPGREESFFIQPRVGRQAGGQLAMTWSRAAGRLTSHPFGRPVLRCCTLPHAAARGWAWSAAAKQFVRRGLRCRGKKAVPAAGPSAGLRANLPSSAFQVFLYRQRQPFCWRRPPPARTNTPCPAVQPVHRTNACERKMQPRMHTDARPRPIRAGKTLCTVSRHLSPTAAAAATTGRPIPERRAP